MHLPLWMGVVLFLCRNKEKTSSFCTVTQKYHISTNFGYLDKIYVVSRLKNSGRTGMLVSHLNHHPCLC